LSTNSGADNTQTATIEESRRQRRSQLPKPYPDPAQWDSNLEAVLSSDPRRRANYELFQKRQKTPNVDYLPTMLDIENVSRCNFRCTMCQVSDWGPNFQRSNDMTLEQFKELIDEQYGLISIKLQGMGEPLLGRDVFFNMIRYARSKHIWVRSTNNGSLLHYRDNYKKLIDSGINEVQQSIDGATKETYETIRRGANFDLVINNCKRLNDYCDELSVLRTRMAVVLQQGNLHEFFDLIELGAQTGFKRVTFFLSLNGWGQESWTKTNRATTVEDHVTPDMAERAIQLGRSLGTEVTFWDVTEKYSTHSRETICTWPFERSFVSSDMRVVPCCMIANPDVSDLGDAKRFIAEWHGEPYQEFRRAHLEGRIPDICKACYYDRDTSRNGGSQ
jgi:pyrroloquinoline quinone biosynthesis protein E